MSALDDGQRKAIADFQLLVAGDPHAKALIHNTEESLKDRDLTFLIEYDDTGAPVVAVAVTISPCPVDAIATLAIQYWTLVTGRVDEAKRLAHSTLQVFDEAERVGANRVWGFVRDGEHSLPLKRFLDAVVDAGACLRVVHGNFKHGAFYIADAAVARQYTERL